MKFCVSEADARTKWCPMARDVLRRGGNRSDYGGYGEPADPQYGAEMAAHYPCIGSRCMAWRWVETHLQDERGDFTIRSDDTHGYCGLAGDPRER